jgi:hypothetical protein
MDYYGVAFLIWREVIEFGSIDAKSCNIFLCYIKYLALDPDLITSTLCLQLALVRNDS